MLPLHQVQKRTKYLILKLMKYAELYKLIESAGWTLNGGTNHYKYVHPNFDYYITVPRHSSKEVPKGTLNKILKDAGMKNKK